MEVLEQNMRKAINRMKQNGTVSASAACVKANTSTRGLSCTLAEYQQEIDRLVKTIKVSGFVITP